MGRCPPRASRGSRRSGRCAHARTEGPHATAGGWRSPSVRPVGRWLQGHLGPDRRPSLRLGLVAERVEAGEAHERPDPEAYPEDVSSDAGRDRDRDQDPDVETLRRRKRRLRRQRDEDESHACVSQGRTTWIAVRHGRAGPRSAAGGRDTRWRGSQRSGATTPNANVATTTPSASVNATGSADRGPRMSRMIRPTIAATAIAMFRPRRSRRSPACVMANVTTSNTATPNTTIVASRRPRTSVVEARLGTGDCERRRRGPPPGERHERGDAFARGP